jgi:hypothetical protein
MRLRLATVSLALVAGCVTTPPADPVPEILAVDQMWGHGIHTLGYFTPAEERSPAWEKARLAYLGQRDACDGKQSTRRDVRWYPPVAAGEPSCAKIVYTFSCSSADPHERNELEYDRKQALLDDPGEVIGPNCGEKDRAKRPAKTDYYGGLSGEMPDRSISCRDLLPDETTGEFHLREVNYVRARAIFSPGYIRTENVGAPYPVRPATYITGAARQDGRVHFVLVDRPLLADKDNIFIEQVFTANHGEGYCVMLTARQGKSVWRKTIKRDSIPQKDRAMLDEAGRPKDPKVYWDQYSDSEMLQGQLAQHLGLKPFEYRPD